MLAPFTNVACGRRAAAEEQQLLRVPPAWRGLRAAGGRAPMRRNHEDAQWAGRISLPLYIVQPSPSR